MTRRFTSLEALPAVLTEAGVERVLLLTGGSGRFVDHVTRLVAGFTVEVFSGARRHVPEAVLAEARDKLTTFAASSASAAPVALVALGGGAPIGLGKALRLEHPGLFVALPTTYSGSEYTDIFGVTADGHKRTGRDPKVRPDVVIHDVALTLAMPRALTVTSLMNALAHPIATLAAGLLSDERKADGLAAIAKLVGAIDTLVQFPESRRARAEALEGAGLAAMTLEIGTPGLHHQLAHRLGGRFDLEHGALHAVLLPHTLRRLRDLQPDVVAAIDDAARVPDLEATLFDQLARAGAPTSLKAMGVTLPQILELLQAAPDLPPDVVRAAYHGRRPSRSVRREDWGLAEPVSVRGALPKARRVVVALHGRGATADSIVRRTLEIVGDDPDVAVVAPHGVDNLWYGARFSLPRREIGAELDAALAVVRVVLDRVLAEVPPERVALFGFSQGACLAIDAFLSRGQRLAALVALSGSAIGADEELVLREARRDEGGGAPTLAGTPVLLGVADADPWIPLARVEATAALLAASGCVVHSEHVPGGTHTFHVRHRILARPLLSGLAPAPTPTGFGNSFELEGLPGALPRDRNTPRLAPFGLYPEQLSVTSFVAPRHRNRRVWLYRVRPANRHGALVRLEHPRLASDFTAEVPEANLAAFAPPAYPEAPRDFVDGLFTLGGAGAPGLRRGYAVHLYAANRNMEDRAFHDADGDLLILPQEGALTLLTELGALDVRPGEIALVPRGLRFSVQLVDDRARGWIGEAFGAGFALPERGPVGANGLADARHFRAPVPWFEDRLAPGYRMTMKLGGALFEATQDTSPFDVVAWHGEAAPFVYDLRMFSPIAMARIDHIDPSAHAVVSAPLDPDGANALDLIAFVPRWDATEGTFRPPYFHRNVTTEINGVIAEVTSESSPFQPGTTFITPSMVPHGPGAAGVERVFALDSATADRPARGASTSLWFQLESALPFVPAPWAADESAPERLRDWHLVWGFNRSHFDPSR
ncbi:MAG: homogentisate 1,2-dioxygenase [Deltaproteobacteria bacterium]|nr:homogentisate 1,2-dioxygenase [Deltaproteobacteria bacterium]